MPAHPLHEAFKVEPAGTVGSLLIEIVALTEEGRISQANVRTENLRLILNAIRGKPMDRNRAGREFDTVLEALAKDDSHLVNMLLANVALFGHELPMRFAMPDVSMRDRIQIAGHGVGKPGPTDQVDLFAMSLPETHPVRRMYEESGASVRSLRWLQPYQSLVRADVQRSDDHLKNAYEALTTRIVPNDYDDITLVRDRTLQYLSELFAIEDVANALHAATKVLGPRDRKVAFEALTQIGTVVTAHTRAETKYPPEIPDDITTLWSDGCVEFDGVRRIIPGLVAKGTGYWQAHDWLTHGRKERPDVLVAAEYGYGLK